MADYNLVRDRDALYAVQTGLSVSAVVTYRKTRVNDWTTQRDRKIGSTIRGLERMWTSPEITWEQWVDAASSVLGVIKQFVEGVITKVKELAEALADALVDFAQALERRLGILKTSCPIVWDGLTMILGALVERLSKN